MINLNVNARPDERFHLQDGPPVVVSHFDWGWLRRTKWAVANGRFVSWWFFGHLQWYHGDAKHDATRTCMYEHGQLGQPVEPNQYVMTTTPSELLAFRWRAKGPGGPPVVSDMGGT